MRKVRQTRRTPVVEVRCPQCGGTAELSFGDTFVGGKLRNWEALRCDGCAVAYTADGYGRLPESQRRSVLALLAVRVDPAVAVPRLVALRAMRTLFGGTPANARVRWSELLAGEPMTESEADELASLVPGIAFVECVAI